VLKLGDPGVPADCTLLLSARAKDRQKLDRLRVRASCPQESCRLKVSGQIRIRARKRFKYSRLPPTHHSLGAGEEQKVRIRIQRSKHLRIRRALAKKGRSAKVGIQLRAGDTHGITTEQHLGIKLRP
jgi:hypothetical protein